MKQGDESSSEEIGKAVARAFGKLEGLLSRLGDDRQLQGEPPAPPAPPAPLAARVVAVGASVDWWPGARHRLQPGEALILGSATAAWLAIAAGGVPVPFRVLATFWFLLACPGFAALRLLQIRNPAILATLSLGASIGILTVLSEAMLYTHTWSPGVAVAGLAGFSLVALAAGRLCRVPVGQALS